MTHSARNVHPAAMAYAQEVADGTMDRREFLTRATALGVSASVAYGLIGSAKPARAAGHIQQGGTIRIQQEVRAMKDPPSYDWPQIANFSRGWLEYLVEYSRDGVFSGRLLENWEVNEDATQYTLYLRQGVMWNDGTPFTSADVAYNITRWCDRSMEGNAMASRMGALIDEATGAIADGVLEVVDDHTVVLNLAQPDITIIPTMSDYPSAIVQNGFSGSPVDNPVGTGPYRPVSYEVGVGAVMEKNPDHTWWDADNGAALDRIEFVDLGTDQSAHLAAAEAGEIDMLYETVGNFVDIFDSIGWTKSEALSANSLVLRTNQNNAPYDDVRVRRALALACDNSVLLEIGYDGRGTVAENHHVCPIHPEYADIGPPEYNPEEARRLMEEAGVLDFEHELISIDDSWRRPTSDALAAQLRDAGLNVTRTIYPGSTFWNDWAEYPFSSTDWGHRPLGVQNLTLAYKSGEPWNETGFNNEEFDTLLAEASAIADAEARSQVMARIQQIMRDEGVIIQPYWRSVYRHHREDIVGAETHPIYEIHLHYLGFAA
ncbi:diguanylate cyclase [Roseobacter sp. HKCCD9010]|uniref:ABC transporter substrate-binding protein n=1 Tax=unclassified Roseobacter TaxID=196798 RepID=UPI0014917238|nr:MULTISPECIES: ABC transporter substrate-binding protein [unclassified Roseobacter]MBF9049194.1 diguanylate cyclase [Rhodobacterales bacterium HKCCD4356]NNV11194.1 diguanylate cyclase [Roseobacter sp. HKCCD7357]NNV15378.1 diguanylate cyclase [Roseobacter sp. HKCCD8768]NNV24838.1 diguanylate cyclase [Roseobacter sp. HKCCD8192]NNV29094.1 diguanylate cyclase [Roseobacter sp. HKCCD9061]